MIKFSQKQYGSSAVAAAPKKPAFTKMDAGLGVGFAALGHIQNKKAEKEGAAQLAQNEQDFKNQMKQREDEFKAQMEAEKSFAMAALTVGSMGVSAIQGHKANKVAAAQAEAANEQQMKFQKQQLEQNERFQKEQMKMQEQAAKLKAKAIKEAGAANTFAQESSGGTGMAAFSEISEECGTEQKEFARVMTAANVKGLIKDVGRLAFDKKGRNVGQKIANGVVMGAGMAGVGAIVDKGISADAKRRGIIQPDTPEQAEAKKQAQKKNLAKVAGTAAAIGGTVLAAKSGKLNAVGKKVGINNLQKSTNRVLKDTGTMLKNAGAEQIWKTDLKTGKVIKKGGKKVVNKMGIGMTLGFGMLPAASYIPQAIATKNQQAQTAQVTPEEQRQYAATGITKFIKKTIPRIGKNIQKNGFFKTMGTGAKTVGGKIAKGADTLFTGGAVSGSGQFARDLKNTGSNPLSKKVGNYLSKKKGAGKYIIGAAAVVPGYAVTMGTWGLGDKAVKTTLGAVDKNAFQYENSQNQTAQQ